MKFLEKIKKNRKLNYKSKNLEILFKKGYFQKIYFKKEILKNRILNILLKSP